MNMALRAKKPDALPMTVKVTREVKGLYLCRLRFHPSRRLYDDELIRAPSKREATAIIKAKWPNIVGVRK